MKEIYKRIILNKNYTISNLWNIKNRHWRILKVKLGNAWYKLIWLSINWIQTTYLVHRLIMFTFIWESKKQVNHKNGIKT